MNVIRNHRLFPWIILLIAGVPWSLTFVLAIVAMERGDHPIGVGFWQALVGTVLLFIYNASRGKPWIPISKFYLIFYAVCGVAGTTLPQTLLLFAAEHLSAGVISITAATTPMLTFALAFVFRLEGFAWTRLLGILLGCTAILFVTIPETSLPDPSVWPWVLVAVLASVSFSGENIIISKFLPTDDDPFVILGGMLAAGTLLTVPLMIATDAMMIPAWPPEAVEWSILGMAVINVLAYGLFVYLIGLTGPVFASQLGYVITIAGIAWGMIIFAEEHSLWFWGALALMLVGLTLVRPRENVSTKN